jgi:hypothetical protein
LVVGDAVIGINRFGGVGAFEFRPAAGVTVCITDLGNRGGVWNGLVSVANPISGVSYATHSATTSNGYKGKLFIDNTNWLAMLEHATYDNNYSGIQTQ